MEQAGCETPLGRHVMVNGKLLVRDRRILTMDTRQVLRKAAEYQSQIRRSLR